ncbi:FAD-dependent monooxygenase [Paracoccus aminophilus]|uniref:Pentachlorophenol monooxygenase n=1 Tax=Paracoccus aminophilus JCM 7686 TaxID=1367847 RepID=S5Y0E8_PARAH|nr:FAD-dependent monooxygenase [Paracoccus aminophilus]AGT09200.1 pentachlorophenol monooxygenase [Paracoccus aminophilus JCM 7686]
MTDHFDTDVLVVGAGPAGAILSDVLARQGIRVTLAERAATAERSFRGETVAALSVKIMEDLGYGDRLKQAGYLPLEGIAFRENGRTLLSADYSRFPIGQLPIDMPQPQLLGVAIEAARSAPSFSFLSGTQFLSLIEEDGVVKGAMLRRSGGEPYELRARLTVGCDGRFSRMRKLSGLEAKITPMERDFLWFKLPRPENWQHTSQLVARGDRHLVILPTWPDLLRVGYNVPKGGFRDQREQGITLFQDSVAALDPRLADLVRTHIRGWDDVTLLDIFTAEMEQWSRDGLLLIGDSAHTVTPVLGQGVNLAIQDAVSFAPAIYQALADSTDVIPASALQAVIAKRRSHKAMITKFQRMQEGNLAQGTRFGTFLRRLKMRLLNHSPVKYKVLDRMMNAPHALRQAPEYRAMLERLAPIGAPVDAADGFAPVAPAHQNFREEVRTNAA